MLVLRLNDARARMLDYRVLELAVNEMAAAPDLTASVNVSPASTVDPDWWAGLGALLRANTSAPHRDHQDRGDPGRRRRARLRNPG
jgi:hypothetical protein